MVYVLHALSGVSDPKGRGAGDGRLVSHMRGCQTSAIPQRKAPTETIRRVRHELAPVLQQAHDPISNAQPTSENNAGDRMKTHFKFRDNAEVSPATTEGPEEIAIFLGAGAKNRTIRGNEIEARDVIAG